MQVSSCDGQRSTPADVVARAAVRGYAADVISAAVFAYVVLPRRWQKLIASVRRERLAWVSLEHSRVVLAQSLVARALQRVWRSRRSEAAAASERRRRGLVLFRFLRQCVGVRRTWRAVDQQARRYVASVEWVEREVVAVCRRRLWGATCVSRWWTSRRVRIQYLRTHQATRRIQRIWRDYHIRQQARRNRLLAEEQRHSRATTTLSRWLWRCAILKRHADRDRREEEFRTARRSVALSGFQTRWRQRQQQLRRSSEELQCARTMALESPRCSSIPSAVMVSVPPHGKDSPSQKARTVRVLTTFLHRLVMTKRATAAKLKQQASLRIARWLWRLYVAWKSERYQLDGVSVGPEVDLDDPGKSASPVPATAPPFRPGFAGVIPIRPPKPACHAPFPLPDSRERPSLITRRSSWASSLALVATRTISRTTEIGSVSSLTSRAVTTAPSKLPPLHARVETSFIPSHRRDVLRDRPFSHPTKPLRVTAEIPHRAQEVNDISRHRNNIADAPTKPATRSEPAAAVCAGRGPQSVILPPLVAHPTPRGQAGHPSSRSRRMNKLPGPLGVHARRPEPATNVSNQLLSEY